VDYFWSNTIWYLILGMLTLFVFVFALVKRKNRKLVVALYMTLTGFALIFETIVKIVFKAYMYFPKIIMNSQYDDSLAGNLFSQFSVGATALIVAVFQLRFYWYALLAGVYCLIEELFLAMGIFSHNWYRTWMTFVSLIIFFWLAKKLYFKIKEETKLWIYYLSIFAGMFTLDVVTLIWGLILSGFQDYSREYFSDPVTSRYLLGVLYFTVVATASMLIYFFRLKWKWKTIVFLALYGMNYLCDRLHIFYIKDGWFLICSTITIFWIYFSVIFMEYLFRDRRSNNF
jgi:hypothetical protein